MNRQPFDVNEMIDKMMIPNKEAQGGVACAPAEAAAIRYLVLRKSAIILPAGHETAHRERVMVPADVYDELALQYERTAGALNQTSYTAELMCLERNTANEQCIELAQRVKDQALQIDNLERQLFDRGRP